MSIPLIAGNWKMHKTEGEAIDVKRSRPGRAGAHLRTIHYLLRDAEARSAFVAVRARGARDRPAVAAHHFRSSTGATQARPFENDPDGHRENREPHQPENKNEARHT